jgi:cytochrome c
MKTYITVFTLVLFISCKDTPGSKSVVVTNNPVTAGQELFEGAGNCIACHKTDQKIIGPSIKEIATIYKQKKGNLVAFLKGIDPPIVDPSQYESMKINLEVTKNMKEGELKALEAYIYSFN